MQYLDYAHNLGVVADFANCGPLYLTIRGREYTVPFNFQIADRQISVNSVQIEVDAGYEGERDIVLVEAKIGIAAHLNVRQLYYPYRHFSTLFPRKHVRCLFFQHDLQSAAYIFHEFGFRDPLRFDSIQHLRCRSYMIGLQTRRAIDELIDVRYETTTDTVPQADDFNKILGLLNAIDIGYDSSSAVALYFAFTPRQGDYYSEAAEYLGFITRRPGLLELTDRGIMVLSSSPTAQEEHLAKAIVNSWVFRELIRRARQKGLFDIEDVESIIASVPKSAEGGQRYNNTTIPRRRKTIIAWLNWLSNRFGCFERQDGRYLLR
jgi:hypothetical protein